MSARIRTLFQSSLLLSLVGWANALYTLIHRQSLLAGSLSEPAFCNIGQTFNCDAVALSSYSSFASIPVSAWGMLFYTILICFTVWGLFGAQDSNKEQVRSAAHILLIATAVGLIPSAWLAFASFYLLGSICLLCLLTYIINLVLIGLAFSLQKNSREFGNRGLVETLRRLPSGLIWAIVGLGALNLLSPKIVSSSVMDRNLDSELIKQYVARHLQQAPQNLQTKGYPFLGPEDAPITLVEFSDFQCPFCKRASLTLPGIVKAHPKKVKLVFKQYPLSPSCNPSMKSEGHPYACLAAKTAHCVFTLKGNEAFWRTEESLFAAQEKLNTEVIRATGTAAGLTPEELNRCLEDPATHEAIVAQTNEGSAAGVQGTPALFVNGRLAEGGTLPLILQPILEHYGK